MQYLRYEEFVSLGQELEIGEQIHINHEDCDAGEDSKRRLYIKRGDDDGNDIILAYCHHCGKSGRYNDSFSKVKKARQGLHHVTTSTTRDNKIPRDAITSWNDWTKEARVWVSQYGITEEESVRWGLTYSKFYDKVCLPFRIDGDLHGFQLRALHKDITPKYDTRRIISPTCWYSGKVSDTLTIVEDILSGIKCARHTSSLAVLGSGLSDEVFEFISSQGFTNFNVFLDNDNRHVKKNQLVLKNRLELLGNVKIIKELHDPKEFSDEQLKELLL